LNIILATYMVTNIKIAIGSDHAGFELKQIIVEHLSSRNVDFD